MKVVILAGGYGTRISEESAVRPKPMVEIGGMPIIWHIMKIYSAQGLNDFVICLGYKGHMIKDFFANYALRVSDVTFDLRANRTTTLSNDVEPWTVTLIDTGDKTMTGGRIKRVRRVRRRRDVLPDLRRLPRRPRRKGARRLPPRAGSAGDPDRGAAARAVRRDRARRGRDQDLDLRGEARGRRRLDQRRLLRARAARCWTTSPATTRSGSGSRSRRSRARATSPPTSTGPTGRTWTACATRSCSRASGTPAAPPWKIW